MAFLWTAKDYFWNNSQSEEQPELAAEVDPNSSGENETMAPTVGKTNKEANKKKSWFGKKEQDLHKQSKTEHEAVVKPAELQKEVTEKSKKKESTTEFYARMDREREEREAEKRRIKREEQKIKEEEEIQSVKEVEDSIKAALIEVEKKKERELAETAARAKERESSRLLYEDERKANTEIREKELQDKTRRHQETKEKMRREAAIISQKNEEELTKMRGDHAARVEELLKEEKLRMEEMNKKAREKEEERRRQWNRMRCAFMEMMRSYYAGMMINEIEMQWNNRFNELRQSYDPVREAFWALELIPFRKVDLATSLVQFEAHLESLRMSLATLKEIMSIEHEQVMIWKEQHQNAHFLFDFESALEVILSNIELVRGEIKIVLNEIHVNRENVNGLEQIFKLRNLEGKMKELEDAVDSIPNVYELNEKYFNGNRSRHT